MSKVVELVRIGRGTRFAAKAKALSIRIFGKEVARYSIRDTPQAIARAAARDVDQVVRIVTAFVISEALRLYDRFLARFPAILSGVEKATFADIVGQALARGKATGESLRGLIVEKLARHAPETNDLTQALTSIRASMSRGLAKKWGPVRLVSGVTDGRGKQLGDLLAICEHPDGRVWVMAIIESKSLSNVGDLARLGDLPVGQHLWDFARAKAHGLVIEGRYYKPGQVMIQPVPVPARSGPAVVGVKNAAQRQAEMKGLFTQFVGFAPREMTNGQVRQVAAQGIQIELWRWPFDVSEYDKFQQELIKALGRVVR